MRTPRLRSALLSTIALSLMISAAVPLAQTENPETRAPSSNASVGSIAPQPTKGGELAEGAFQTGVQAYQQQRFTQALEKWLEAGELGHPQALFNLGNLYANGEGVSENSALALEYFERAAELGLAAAQHNLALAYFQGRSVKQNPELARSWWQRAAQQGHAQGQYNLGVLLWTGSGIGKNETEALKWFRKAAGTGHQKAQAFLDELFAKAGTSPTTISADPDNPSYRHFEEGRRAFDRKDYPVAMEHWTKAAELGNRGAEYYIAYLHEHGLGVTQAADKALEWYQRAAQNGQAQAQYQIAQYYLNGTGIEKDETLGLFWMQSAADNNDLRAKDYMQQQR